MKKYNNFENLGLIEEGPQSGENIFGVEKNKERIVLQEDRNWLSIASSLEHEIQRYPDFDTKACVSFSALNCIEIIVKRKYDLVWNKSDRFTAKMSETTKFGNTSSKVAHSISTYGVVDEDIYPFDGETFAEYYTEIPEDIKSVGKNLLKQFQFKPEWVDWGGECDKEKLWEALQYAPIWASVRAWPKPDEEGVYQRIEGRRNHKITIVKGVYEDHWIVWDHYWRAFKKLSWNYKFGVALIINVEKKLMKLIKTKDNTDVFCVTPDGKRRYIYNEAQLLEGKNARLWGGFDDIEEISLEEMLKLEEGSPMCFGLK